MQVIRTDPEAGIEERSGFFGPPGEPLFGYSHAALGRPLTAVLVVCPPVLGDLAINYRREVVLARHLAATGVVVQRFQYRGMGNSFGDPARTTFTGLVDDACRAAELARSLAPAAPLVLLGTRLGALVAAAATRTFPEAALVLWEPVADGGAYFREASRAWMIRAMAERRDRPASSDRFGDALREHGWIDVAGDELHLALYESTRPRTLAGELPDGPRAVLVVHPESVKEDSLGAMLNARGCRVEVIRTGEAEAWWFNPTPEPAGVEAVALRLGCWLPEAARLA